MTEHSHDAVVDRIARDYAARGYRVTREPRRGQRPRFLRDYEPDLIARRDDDHVVIEVKVGATRRELQRTTEVAELVASQAGWRYEIVVSTAGDETAGVLARLEPPERADVEGLLGEADALLKEHPKASLLLTWSAVEAACRFVAASEAIRVEGSQSRALLGALYSAGHLEKTDWDLLQQTFELRASVAHGFGQVASDDELRRASREALRVATNLYRGETAVIDVRERLREDDDFRFELLEKMELAVHHESEEVLRKAALGLGTYEANSPQIEEVTLSDAVADAALLIEDDVVVLAISVTANMTLSFVVDDVALEEIDDSDFEVQDPKFGEYLVSGTTTRVFDLQFTVAFRPIEASLEDVELAYAELGE